MSKKYMDVEIKMSGGDFRDFIVDGYSRVRGDIEDYDSKVATVDMTVEQAHRLAELLRPMGMDLKQVSDVRIAGGGGGGSASSVTGTGGSGGSWGGSGTIKASVQQAARPRFEVKWHPKTTHIRTSKDGFQKVEVKPAHINGGHYGLALDTTQHVLWFVSDSPDDLDKNRHLLQALAGGASLNGEAALRDVLRGEHMTHPADSNVKPVPPRRELFLQSITVCAEQAVALGASAQELRHALFAGLGLGDD